MRESLIPIVAAVLTLVPGATAATPPNSPVNQVFQFMYAASSNDWADGAKTTATVYLWIPEKTAKLRGLIIMGSNVPEHMLVGHPAIREVAARNHLGIVWSSPTFWYSKAKNENATIAAFLQRLLRGLAEVSGYEEVATVPWLPMGESGHLLMVDALVEAAPERCIAGIWIKNAHLPPSNRVTPALVVFGTAQEWTQDKTDIRTRWNDLKPYENVRRQRRLHPQWPLSFVIDGHSGHFDVSDRLARYFARYIDLAAKARLSPDGSTALRPVDLKTGFLADVIAGQEGPAPFSQARPDLLDAPWFFDRQAADEAQAFGRINWKAETQLPAFIDRSGNVAPFNFNGISSLTPELEDDGLTFRLRATLLDRIPANFANAGEALAKTAGTPAIEWLCGPVAPAGEDKFRIALDRSYPHHPIYLAARQPGNDHVRASVQPIAIRLPRNTEGAAQRITFDPIPDLSVGSAPVPLSAKSDSGLPVGFFVVAGPAVILDGKLSLTPIPPRAKFPVEVTVAAWQWGRGKEPKVRMADIVRQSFHVVR